MAQRDEQPAPFGPGTYGSGFADVYDEWYPPDDATAHALARLRTLADTGPGERARVLELGVGTGRLAVPLASAGHDVTGLDASPEMLERLDVHAASAGVRVRPVLGDLASPSDWPDGPFDLVIAAFNLVCNLGSAHEQATMFTAAASVLEPGGHLVVEAFLPAPVEPSERRLEVREVRVDRVVLIASQVDDAGLVHGSHIELRDGEPVRLRPWRLRPTPPSELDEHAAAAGLEVLERRDGWAGEALDAAASSADGPQRWGATARVTTYRQPLNPA